MFGVVRMLGVVQLLAGMHTLVSERHMSTVQYASDATTLVKHRGQLQAPHTP